MEVSWRNVALLDATTGGVTPAATALFEQEIADERLAVITLLGTPSNQRARVELFAQLLNQPQQQYDDATSANAPLTLLACVSYMEEDYNVLVLDVNIIENSPANELIGAICALSSLVVSCYDGTAEESAFSFNAVVNPFPSEIASFTSLFQTLLKEHPPVEVYELFPSLLTVDFTPNRTFQDRGRSTNAESTRHEGLDAITQLKRVDGVAYPDEVCSSTQDLEFFDRHAPVKKVFNTELTGDILARMLQAFTRDVFQNGQEPDVGTAWDDIVEQKCEAVADDALQTYLDCIHSSSSVARDEGEENQEPPMELDAFHKLHEEIQRLAMDVYHAGAKPFSSMRKRTIRNKLKASIRTRYEDEARVLRDNSRNYCERIRQSIWSQLSNDEDGDSEENGSSFAAVLNTILRFDAEYNRQASGPEKASVLREFYRHEAIHVFQRLETVVTQQMTDVRLRDLRGQLQREFETKKEALVAHFKQEETQLRACMARELETMQKMHHARHARVKIDENESKRVRDELSRVQTLNAELERKNAVLEQSQDELHTQRAALERKVDELELAVRQEMASRAELVDTLAATIKSQEQRERELQSEIARLNHDVSEKTFCVENELKDMTLQLRKTNEEKEELQKQLNDFFLKITTLPAGLQQHVLFSNQSQEEDVEQVPFADALTGFMSG
uniref:Uncharacterized protein n=1 Tax=Globisporangium ultimum (strain ATCC 200006 / CBS 805.95 / DAOM BR144) TaxID=431595 RepID=K3W9R9_GLOUD